MMEIAARILEIHINVDLYMKVVILVYNVRGGYMNLKLRRFSSRAPRDPKTRFLAVHGLYCTNLLEFLKNLNFFGLEVVSKSAMRVFPL